MLIESKRRKSYQWWWIPVALLVSLSLVVVPLPEPFNTWRPDWVALAVVFWAINAPKHVGVMTGWLCGLALDVMQFTLLGQQALSLAIVAWIANRYHAQFLKMPPIQLTACVFALLLFDCVVVAFVQSFVFEARFAWQTCAPAVTAIALWPVITLAMQNANRDDDIL